MSFLFPRTIAITREASASGFGAQAYNATNPATSVASGIAASIQSASSGSVQAANLPTDTKKSYWKIIFQGVSGLVQTADIITDDLNFRYQVVSPYWNSLGYQVIAERLEN